MAPSNRYFLFIGILVPFFTLVGAVRPGLFPIDALLRCGRARKSKGEMDAKGAPGGGADGGKGGAAVAPAAEPSAGRSIADLVDVACAGAGGIPESQRAFAVKMITGLGFADEGAFRAEARYLDWARHMPGFPCRVELCLKKFFDGEAAS